MKVIDASAVILAGGRSSRMGQDKATLRWGEKDILHHLITTLQQICKEVIVVSNRPRELSTPVRIVADIIPDQGPLSGIHAGLLYARYPHSFIIGCDMPFIVPSLVSMLLNKILDWDAVVPIYRQRQQPLFAAYSKCCISVIEELLQEGDRRVISLFTRVRCLHFQENEWSINGLNDKVFYNFNTYDDYQRAISFKGGK